MIYVSIDNDFHTEIATNYIKNFKFDIKNISFISNKSIRNSAIYKLGFPVYEIPGHPFSSGSGFKSVSTYIKAIKQHFMLERMFKFGSNDILVILTEYQINNAYLAKMMKKNGGRIYLLDEGIGFYLNNHEMHKENTTIIDRLFLAVYNLIFLIFLLPIYAKKGQEGRMFVSIYDYLISNFYSSLKIKTTRKIKTIQYDRIKKVKITKSKSKVKSVIYFASNFDCYGLKLEEMKLAKKTINYLKNTFDRVYIKIHPQDAAMKTDLFFFYRSFKKENIQIISNKLTSNQAIGKIKPSLVIGSFSSSLFDAFLAGYTVIFLYQILPKIKELKYYDLILKDFNSFLKITKFNDIKKFI